MLPGFFRKYFTRFLVIIISSSIALLGIEGILRIDKVIVNYRNRQNHGDIAGVYITNTDVIMPDEYKMRFVTVDGAIKAYYWQNKLHVFDIDGFRTTTPFPPKNDHIFRIAVIGDSLTYGQGVDAQEAYPAVLEKILQKSYNVEVFNMGVLGVNSYRITKILQDRVLPLKPDLVVYGMCLNDFLSGDQYDNNMAYQLPLPQEWKKWLAAHTLTGEFVSYAYDHLLVSAGIREDFMSDIRKNFGNYQQNFARDAKEMNGLVVKAGLPPILAMVVHQDPADSGPAEQVRLIAERIMGKAGFQVIPASYFRTHNGYHMGVNRWEGHPNEEAHRLFAQYFAKSIIALPEITAYAKQ